MAIVRLSGEQSIAILERLGGPAPPARMAQVRRLRDAHGVLLDEALVLRFERGASFTGEPVVELHLHGSVAIVRAVLRAIEETGLAREAGPGEFTRRALMAGRLDLLQVQGLRDLIDAETEGQRRHAMRVYSGDMADRVSGWRRSLLRAASLIEATIDFADEDVPVDVLPEVRALIGGVVSDLSKEVAGAGAAARLKSGFEVALVGAPNVGKSSLLNRLARSEVAIVSDRPGTTRDVIEVRLDLGGVPVVFLDMAGLRDADDEIERLGVERAIRRAAEADIRIFLTEGDVAAGGGVARHDGDVQVRTKVDIYGGDGISALTGEGIEALLHEVSTTLGARVGAAGAISSDRDVALFRDAGMILDGVVARSGSGSSELMADDLRRAVAMLGAVVGEVGVEDVLGEIFATFCIGK